MPSPYSYFADIWLPLPPNFLVIVLSVYAWHGRSVLPALAFSTASLLTALWVAGLLIEDAVINFEAKTVGVNFQEFEPAQTSQNRMRFLHDTLTLKL